MPLKLNATIRGTVEERLAAFRSTIPDGVGYEINELAALPALAASTSQVRNTIREHGWGVCQWKPETRRMVTVLVNARTQQLYAQKPDSRGQRRSDARGQTQGRKG